jgi:hypothetical protein
MRAKVVSWQQERAMAARKVVFLSNGLVFATDERREQMVEIQKQSWFELYLEWLTEQGHDISLIEFTLPDGRSAVLHLDAEPINWTTVNRFG